MSNKVLAIDIIRKIFLQFSIYRVVQLPRVVMKLEIGHCKRRNVGLAGQRRQMKSSRNFKLSSCNRSWNEDRDFLLHCHLLQCQIGHCEIQNVGLIKKQWETMSFSNSDQVFPNVLRCSQSLSVEIMNTYLTAKFKIAFSQICV